MDKQDLVGTWRGAGQKVFNADGTLRSSRGPSPSYILYTQSSHMIVLATEPEGISAAEPAKMSDADKAKAADACVAYFGPYEVKGGTVYHHIEAALFPAWVGKTRVRHASIEGARLTYVTEPGDDGSVSHIYWERV